MSIYYLPMQIKLPLMLLILLAISTACSKPEPPTINLYRAVHIGDINQVERNLNWDSNVNQPGQDGLTALHVAAHKGSLVMVKMLLQHGADKEVLNKQGHTPLATALLARNTLVADYLVKQQANIDPDALLRQTVLLGQADRDVIDFLTKQGAALDNPDAEGNTALHLAIINGRRVIAKYLVQKGADIDLADSSGRTPLQVAIELNQKDIEQMLRKFGAITSP
ncbi:MAG: ankyrin repeat domain-containing protein [Pseudomonadota bacterium]